LNVRNIYADEGSEAMDAAAAPAVQVSSFPDGDNCPIKTVIFDKSETAYSINYQALARYTRREATCLSLTGLISATLTYKSRNHILLE